MERAICDYYKDERNDWVAILDCHHGQHVRHNPPFVNRPWIETEEGRAAKIGLLLNCVRCDRFEFPDGLTLYKQTPEFDETTIPKGLLHQHSTKTGTWGMIRVHQGALRYVTDAHSQLLSVDFPGVVVPNMPHHVEPELKVRFHVEFYRRP
tara:strand:- start:613 stop:1065 length:453 start_codon:yes stop_codon:yes gene_type:complete